MRRVVRLDRFACGPVARHRTDLRCGDGLNAVPVAVLRDMESELQSGLFAEFHALRQHLAVVDARYMLEWWMVRSSMLLAPTAGIAVKSRRICLHFQIDLR